MQLIDEKGLFHCFEISWNRNSRQGTSIFTQSATESKKISREMIFSEQSPVPKLIVNKRQLSTAQKDASLIQ